MKTLTDLELDAHVVEHLREASDVLDKSGWCQYVGSDANGQHCTVNSLHEVSRERHAQLGWNSVQVARRAVWFVARTLGFGLDAGLYNYDMAAVFVAKWNDQPGRTVEDVHLQLKRAVELCESEMEPGRA